MPRPCGPAGCIENCQIGVILADAAPRGRAFLVRALHRPKAWATDRDRRQAAGIPPEVSLATKPALARTILARAFAAGVPTAWVTADSVYGSDSKRRVWLQAERRADVLAVTGAHHSWQGGIQRRIAGVAAALPDEAWQRLTVGAGSKGPRVFDWAHIRLPYDTEPGFRQWVLVRRAVREPEELACYRVFGLAGTTLPGMARVAGTRCSPGARLKRTTACSSRSSHPASSKAPKAASRTATRSTPEISSALSLSNPGSPIL
ncbi:MAG: transposase [Chloroflexia bacterium]|nr:transposase [Chloroflexia bacterium]